jgi:NADPH2:quinone reductase
MEAIRVHQFGGPEVLRLEALPDPAPQPGQVVVELKAIGVNPVDTYIRAGKYGDRAMPYVPGMDGAGVIKAVGKNATSVQPGARVYFYSPAGGAYATHILLDAAAVRPLPDHFTFAQGAALGVPYLTAYYALFHRGLAKAGETLLVHGASGGVGIAAVQLARAKGLRIIGTAGSDKGRELVKRQGADEVLDHHAPDYLEKLMRLTENKGVDLVIEMLANVNLAKDLTVLNRHGRIVVVGSRGTIEINPRDAMARHADIRGMMLMSIPDTELNELFEKLQASLEAGHCKPVIGQELPLAEAESAHEAIMSPGAYGKIVLVP